MGADLGFEDEAGVGLRTRSGRTWGAVGPPPAVTVSNRRGGDTVLSTLTAKGELRDVLAEQEMKGNRDVEFLQLILHGRTRPLMLMTDQASFHHSTGVREFVRAPRTQLRLFFFPTHSPDLNPDEPVWNELKHRHLGKQPLQNKTALKRRIRSLLKSWQHKAEKGRSLFQLPDTKYTTIPEAAT